MKKQITILLSIFTLILGSIASASAAIKLPQTAMGIPKIFLDIEESDTWAAQASQRNFGELSEQFWKVYIDRDSVRVYESSSKTSKSKLVTGSFLKDYFVAEVVGDYALLYTEKNVQTNLTISKEAKAFGWVNLDHLLLWSSCPRTRNQVYQKAVIVKDIDEWHGFKGDTLDFASPKLSKTPNGVLETGYRANDLDFYFVYKYADNNSVLLCKNNTISSNGIQNSDEWGWMLRGLYTSWNDRICYEPNFGSQIKMDSVAILETQNAAKTFKNTGAIEHAIWKEQLTDLRWSPDRVRFPVLSTNAQIVEVGTIGQLGGTSSNSLDPQKKEAINQKVNALEKKLQKVNVVFVVDGTSSMKNYYRPMAQALIAAMNRTELQGTTLNFGAVVYRNYADEKEGRLIESKTLSTDYKGLANWLNNIECRSIGQGHYEAMYNGIEYAIDKMRWNKDNANFLILVGDAANAQPDAKGKTIDMLVNKLTEKQINFIAFQVNKLDHQAYYDFDTQIQEIESKELAKLTKRKIVYEDFKPTKRGNLFGYHNRDNGFEISAAFSLARPNESVSPIDLQGLIVEEIETFKQQADNNLAYWRKGLENLGGRTILDPTFVKVLKEKGFSDKEIAYMKEKNMQMKVKGFTSMKTNGHIVFKPVVFMAQAELTQLRNSLANVFQSSTTNRRLDVQQALKKLALSYIGQSKDAENVSLQDLFDAMCGITETTGTKIFNDIHIEEITNPNKFPEARFEALLRQIKSGKEVLDQKSTDKTCYFEKNGSRYYYILLEDMPFQHN